MSFFSKLKDRMFRSSNKIGEGLDALVQEGATPPEAEPLASSPIAAPAAALADDKVAGASTAPTSAPTPDVTPAAETPVAAEPLAEVVPPVTQDIADDPLSVEKQKIGDLSSVDKSFVDGAVAPVQPRVAEPAAALTQIVKPAPAPEPAKPGFFGRLFGGKTVDEPRRELDDAMLESLEELLIQADMGVETAMRVTANIAEGRFGKKISTRELKEALAAEITRIMTPVARPLPIYAQKPQVVLVVGVNGSGKTTTIGKLASQFRTAGKTVVIAAGDTFRAAAVEQLKVWGTRANVPVLTAPEGSDPASLAFDALTRAQNEGADLLMIDTAGRLQNRQDLMEELAKIVRVLKKKDETAPHNTLLVLDATTGQNAVTQVEIFRKIADVSGLVMTKLDGTAKGGVLVSLADKFGLPIHAIGVGEQIEDLSPFDPEDFARALVGLDAK